MRALVVGSAGQDGRILVGQLCAKGRAVVGVDRDLVTTEGTDALSLPFDLQDRASVVTFVAAAKPDEVFYLAAHHHSSQENQEDVPELFRLSVEVNVTGLVHVLDAIERHAPAAHFFYAASSHVFGRPAAPVQDEQTPRNPIGVYGITKSAGMDAVRFYRERGFHASAGILYNHESIHRSEKFVSMRLARAAQRAVAAKAEGKVHRIEVGSLAAVVDWGYAPDYTKAMQRIVEQPAPGDYVVATGEPHTVSDFAEAAFSSVGLDFRAHVSEAPGILRSAAASGALVGDARKLRETTGWHPTLTFREMVSRLTRGEL